MIIACPSCQTRFQLDAAKLQPVGRHVRCAKCAHRWLQLPEGMELPAGLMPPETPEAEESAAPAPEPAPAPAAVQGADQPPGEAAVLVGIRPRRTPWGTPQGQLTTAQHLDGAQQHERGEPEKEQLRRDVARCAPAAVGPRHARGAEQDPGGPDYPPGADVHQHRHTPSST